MSASPAQAAAVNTESGGRERPEASDRDPTSLQRITLVIASLASGGAERVMTTMANHWSRSGRHVSLISMYSKSTDFFALEPGVRRISLGLGFATSGARAAILSNIRRIRHLRRAIVATSPDVVISFMSETNVLTVLALRGTSIPLVISERTDPAHQPIGAAWRLLRRLTYPRAGAIVVQSPEVRAWTAGFVAAERVHVIANPVAPHPIATNAAAAAVRGGDDFGAAISGTTILAMGRLSREKGFDVLIRAFARVASRHPAWSLVILGEGERRSELESLARELGVTDRVRLPGRVSEPAPYLAAAGVFVLPSRYEGFPNALLEAMAAGLAAIATDCPSGPRHIVRHGEDGLLVPPEDEGALAETLNQMLASPQLRTRLGTRAQEVVERFGLDRVMGQWDGLLGSVAGSRRRDW